MCILRTDGFFSAKIEKDKWKRIAGLQNMPPRSVQFVADFPLKEVDRTIFYTLVNIYSVLKMHILNLFIVIYFLKSIYALQLYLL